MKITSGKQIKPNFNPQIIANFQQVWDSTFCTSITSLCILITESHAKPSSQA